MKKKSILLVDDDIRFLDMVTAVLESRYRVTTASSGRQALELLGDSKPDLVILDVMMSHLSEGFDVSRQIRANRDTDSIPIVMLTGVDDVYDTSPVVAANWHGCDRYMTKPVDPSSLLETIEELTAAKPLEEPAPASR